MSIENRNFNLPVFSHSYQNFLVEELVLCQNPIALHYGNCTVIGRLIIDNGHGQYFLENIRIPSLNADLPDGTLALPLWIGKEFLHAISKFRQTISVNVYVQIWGPAFLRNKTAAAGGGPSIDASTAKDVPPLITSCSLMMEVRELQMKMEADRGLPPRQPSGFGDKGMNSTIRLALKQLVHQYKDTYEPAVCVQHFQRIDQPHETIACNLEPRIYLRKYKNRDIERNKAKGK